MAGVAEIAVDNQLCIEVNQRGSYLLETGQWSDCNFLVGMEDESESDGVVVACHKLILSMASPVFEAMFYGDMAEKNDPIPIVDVQPATFMALLEYIYTGKLNISCVEIAYELCYTAKKYMLMEHVERECIRYIWKQINPSNVCQVYEYALLFESNSLIKKCVQVICMHTKSILRNKSFLDVPISTAKAIFSMDYLDIGNEFDLIEACIRYAQNDEKKSTEKRCSLTSGNDTPNNSNTPEPSTSKTVDVVNAINFEKGPETTAEGLCECDYIECGLSNLTFEPINTVRVRGLIEQIRFLTLTLDQLSVCTAVLSDSERYAIGANIASSDCDVPMPSGFSTSRIRRHLMVDLGDDADDETRPYANFRYRIESLSHLTEDIWSPSCYVRNLSWQLKLIPRLSPSQNNHHKKGLILQCNSDDELSNWSCDARIVIATVHKTGFPAGFKYYLHSFRSESNTLAMPLEWDVLLNPQNEYIRDDSITFEVRMITDVPYEQDSHRVSYMPHAHWPRGD